MNNKIKIKFSSDSHNTIKNLYRKQINIYNIDYTDSGNIYTIDEKDLENLNLDDVEILSYRGFKNLFLKVKRNIHFLLATIISMLLLLFLSNCIVRVDIIHSSKDIRELLETELYSLGIKPFTLKKSFNAIQEIKNHIKNEYPNDIEWLEIIDDGMKYTIRVEERILTNPKKEAEYCNVVSTKDAIIMNVTSQKGQSILNINDHVKNGDIIISGQIKFNEETKSHTCASGIVYGNTWYRVATSVPFEHTSKDYTGKTKHNLAFEFGTNYNRIFKVHYDEYDVEKKCLFRLGLFAIYKETIKEYTTQKKTYTEEEAYQVALKEAREKLEIKLGPEATILNEKVLQSNTYNSIISIDVFYSVKEVISKQVESKIEELPEPPKEPESSN